MVDCGKGVQMKKVCIIANTGKEDAVAAARELPDFFRGHGIACSVLWEDFAEPPLCEREAADDTDCAIVLGGDGTMIRAAAKLAKRKIPVFGINFGHLGFLAGAEQRNRKDALEKLLAGQFQIEERMMLDVFVNENHFDTALNDVVVSRSGVSRIVGVHVLVNETAVFSYHGDGVIVATPTGSTGYNLSAGGPVLVPTTQAILVTPVCPHSLTARGIVLSAEDTVRLEIAEETKTQEEEAIVTVDGWNCVKLSVRDRLEVRTSGEKAYLIRLNDRSFFELLHRKLGNGER